MTAIRTAPNFEPLVPTRTAGVAGARPSTDPTPISTQRAREDAEVLRAELGPEKPGVSQADLRFLIRGGLYKDDAEKLLRGGATKQEAIAMLTLRMRLPGLDDFGPAVFVNRLLQVAIEGGFVSGFRVRELVSSTSRLAVVRPDGYLVNARTGLAIEKLGSPREVANVHMFGDLPLGSLLEMKSGVLWSVDARFRAQRPVGELGLQQTWADAVLDGFERLPEAVLLDPARLIYRLNEDPEGTLEAMGDGFLGLPATIVKLVMTSPERLAAFQRMTTDEQIAFVTEAMVDIALFFAGVGAFLKGAGTIGKVGQGAQALRLADTGRLVAFAIDVRLAAVGAGQLAAGAGAMGAGGSGLGAVLAEAYAEYPHPTSGHRHAPTSTDFDELVDLAGDPRDPKMSFDEIGETYRQLRALRHRRELVPQSRFAAFRRLVQERIVREFEAIKGYKGRGQSHAAKEFRKFLDDTGLRIHDAVAVQREAIPPSALTGKARAIYEWITGGPKPKMPVTHETIREFIRAYPEYVNTEGLGVRARKILDLEKNARTFHWDDVMEERLINGKIEKRVVGHGNNNDHGTTPHFQIHTQDETFRIDLKEPRK